MLKFYAAKKKFTDVLWCLTMYVFKNGKQQEQVIRYHHDVYFHPCKTSFFYEVFFYKMPIFVSKVIWQVEIC